jgi:hypothetical protein
MIKLDNLTLPQLDYLCAKAQGWEVRTHRFLGKAHYYSGKEPKVSVRHYHPTTNNAQSFKLIEVFGIEFTKSDCGYRGRNYTGPMSGGLLSGKVVGGIKDLKLFISTVVVASHYGEDIDPKLLEVSDV